MEYEFTNTGSPNNDGRILARKNLQSGETVQYSYDNLNRLLTAETTSAAWGLSWDYDGFGNRWTQLQTKGTAPGNTISFDQTKNQVNTSQYGYDLNGNMTAMPGGSVLGYDVENRLGAMSMSGTYESYAYLADNKRVWKYSVQGSTAKEEYYLYGVGGQRIASYTATFASGTLSLNSATKKIDVYLGGRAVWQNGKPVVQDRLGSVMARGNEVGGVETHDYFPYGEERVATVGDRNKFGTYHRDQTGLDYADQRYYASALGQFLTSDPAETSAAAIRPNSWSRNDFVSRDPINRSDPTGLGDEGTFCDYYPDSLVCLQTVTCPDGTRIFPGGMCPSLSPDPEPTQTNKRNKRAIGGYDLAREALSKKKCAESLGAKGSESAIAALDAADIVGEELGAPTASAYGDGLIAVNFRIAETSRGTITINTSGAVFDNPENVTVVYPDGVARPLNLLTFEVDPIG